MPVIFYTGQGSEEVARQAFKAGATDYFVKDSADFAQKEKMVNAVQKAVKQCAVEAALEEQRAILEGFFENNPYSIQIYDRQGSPLKINRAHTKMFGCSPSREEGIIFDESLNIPEEVKKSLQTFFSARAYNAFTDEAIMSNEETRNVTLAWKNGDVIKYPYFWYSPPIPSEVTAKRTICTSAQGFSLKNTRGEIVNYMLMHEDITARVEAEEVLRIAHEELAAAHHGLETVHGELRSAYESVEQKVAERTAELAEANGRLADTNSRLADTNKKLKAEITERSRLQGELEQRNRELEDFAHMVSHDLRNNLLVMQRLMEAAALPRADRESIYESLVANTENLRDFVERLLTLARAGKAIGHRMKIPVALVAEKAFSAAAAAHDGAELTLEKSFPPVTCDPDAMEQVFFNLFTNALAHIPSGTLPRLEVCHEVKGKSIEITVKDNGTGIPAGILPRIFDVTCTTGGKGRFGFGLAIVKKLVEAHGGSVRAESVVAGSVVAGSVVAGSVAAGSGGVCTGGAATGARFVINLPHL
jgi:signal transduction histidine kinase